MAHIVCRYVIPYCVYHSDNENDGYCDCDCSSYEDREGSKCFEEQGTCIHLDYQKAEFAIDTKTYEFEEEKAPDWPGTLYIEEKSIYISTDRIYYLSIDERVLINDT